ncbi:MAG: phosphoglucosamine mutase [Clostridiales bacterium]|nr:phosphoglucosamine mutase [Candidatus Equinaster intestinalis]
MTIGEKIAIIRTGAKLSQEELSNKLNVSRQSVSKWEMDQAAPRIDTLLLFCKLFGVSMSDMADETVNIPINNGDASENIKKKVCRYFGTDGFRGETGKDLNSLQAYKIGRFLGWYFTSALSGQREINYRPKIVIGKDTRLSSYTLEYAIASGLTASGADAYILHVTTTPSVSFVTRHDGFDCGVMISASHNPYSDNGIKLVNSAGEKMNDEVLSLIEDYIDGDTEKFGFPGGDIPFAKQENIGTIVDHVAGRNRYIGYLISLAAHSYRDVRVGLDCANGASWMIAPAVFEALGAKTYVIGNSPNGRNINRDIGSTHISALKELVKKEKLDIGFAFDGDADRCIAVDENGNEVNGDHILYILANRLKGYNNLQGNTVVPTVMSNAGLFKALKEAGINTVQAAVGDRYVWEEMVKNGYSLGGEQSGHIILAKYATTGDGILTAIMLLEEVLDKKSTLGTLAAPVKILPQVLKNVRVLSKDAVMSDGDISAKIDEISKELAENGRILLRKSGTEPVIRIMCEGDNTEQCKQYVETVAEMIISKGYAE